MKAFALAIFCLFCTDIDAKVLTQETAVNIGWWQEISDTSKESGMYNRSIVTVHHRRVSDWGSLNIKGQMENIGAMSDSLDGSEGNVWFKTIATLYYNLPNAGVKLWYDLFVNSNQKVSEIENLLGLAYQKKIGRISITGGVAMSYLSGHSPLGSVEGAIAPIARLTANYQINNNLLAFGVITANLNRDTEKLSGSFPDLGNSGHFALIGIKYKFAPQWDFNVTIRDYRSWGAYNNGGNSIVTTVGYYF
ncbi:hypothetical protein FX988_03337 [Paraglaciecola mesophila]|uniref:Uncharacterized protein n=1 Tax=Paraglaciecola mesophila TaxID=197222 RepID=A0A857JLY0_9ALTE|nr:hypothetical protein [Paraglaciecola mesophila]QHJ13079.1 hypothetical protein FX988_03337 [Paraglaciecola mesophila]